LDAQKKTAHAAEQERPDVLTRRQAWFDSQTDLDPARLVFIDETWASTNMARTHGRCPRGEQLRMAVPHGHWKTTTLVAGLGARGVVAPWVLDGPINGRRHCHSDQWRSNGSTFETYVRKVLVPELSRGDVVVMDNLSSHKRPQVHAAIEAAGARVLYLPPYSPDFNPIEKAFAKLKALLRKAAERTVEGLWRAIGRMVDLITPAEARNYFESCGYDAE
jgi:transposase